MTREEAGPERRGCHGVPMRGLHTVVLDLPVLDVVLVFLFVLFKSSEPVFGQISPTSRHFNASFGFVVPNLWSLGLCLVDHKRSRLIKDGLRAFKEDKEEHQDNVQERKIQHNLYKEQRQRIFQLSTLIQLKVASHLQESSCLAGLTLTDWISNLKSSVGADNDTERERVRAWYRTTLRPMRNLSNWSAWANEYDRASASAQLWGVSDVTDMMSITTDFMAAIPRSEQGWCDAFSISGNLQT
ncbi:hypothetical protein E4U52_006556 [Claviceps spartinae]|nr:hypothetical protein E4U52_006556 [Claviceps spartinae]